ncbi:MAG: cyclodeaminase/cyclohydrolase family protein [Stackebrandtia sp.]
MREQTTSDWLDDLASKASAPGGGAAAAMNAAIGAALVSMVCNLTIGKPKYAEHEDTMRKVLSRATQLRTEALRLAEADAEAFAGVAAAYGLARDTDEAKAARRQAIQEALVGAADVPLRTAALAAEVIGLAGQIAAGANVNVLSDVAVAADSARAALRSAEMNVNVNLSSMADAGRREALAARLSTHVKAIDDADEIVVAVAERIEK